MFVQRHSEAYVSTTNCPVTGWPIATRPEWTDCLLEGGTRFSFRVIGGRVLDIDTHGPRSMENEDSYEALRNRVVAEAFPDNQPYVEIQNITGLTGLPSPKLRRAYSSYQLSEAFRNCQGSYVYGSNMLFKAVFRAGIAMQASALNYPMRVVKDYATAMLAARASFHQKRLSESDFHSVQSIQCDDGKGGTEISFARREIVLVRHWGDLNSTEASQRLYDAQVHALRSGILQGHRYFRIADYSRLKHSSMGVRRHYATKLKQLHQEFGIVPELTVMVGAPAWARIGLAFTNHIIPLQIRIVKTMQEAFDLVSEVSRNDVHIPLAEAPDFEQRVSSRDLSRLVQLLGSLAWEMDQEEEEFPEGHPLYDATEAFRLVREDFRGVLERHREAEAKALEASRAKSQFLANMSHEIRTPLNGVVGMVQLLAESPLDEEQRQHAEVALSSAEALLDLVNDILDISKIEAGRLEMENIPFDLVALLAEVGRHLEERARSKGLESQSEIDPFLAGRFHGDPARIRQILLNLVGNALKFTETGHINLIAEPLEETEEGMFAKFSVSDTGIGIPPEVQSVIFETFTQADASTTRRFGGSGLGLSISRQLVRRMGGEIAMTSSPGGGSTFWFTLRLRRAPRDQEASKPTEAILPEGTRILVVEDNVTNQKVAVGILTRAGCRCQVTDNGQAALSALEREDFDLVLMDCQMPVMDGYEATRRIRDPASKVRNHAIPIVAMTANAMSGDREKALEAGMDGFVTKPVSQNGLRTTIAQALANSR